MTEEKDQPRRRRRRSQGEPRYCAFVLETGETHGILLTPENSYATSPSYCKQHHNVMVMRSRQSGPGRESNIERVKRYQQRHPEVVKRLKQEARERKKRGEAPRNPGRGRPRLTRSEQPTPATRSLDDFIATRPRPERQSIREAAEQLIAEAAALAPRCYKPTSSKKYHSYGEAMSRCGQWVTPKSGAFVELPLDHPELCAQCRRKLIPPKP